MQFSITLIRRLANTDAPNSFANKLRTRRFRQFEALIAHIPKPLHILDVGGTNQYWERRGWAGQTDVWITTLNLASEEQRHKNIQPLTGNAINLSQFADRSFDLVFSNSVIEHLFTFTNQRRMALEVQRVGKAIWIQTPNFWFPIEPHFHVPGWQWMPVGLRVAMLRRYTCGWHGPCTDPVRARELVEEVRLLTAKELRAIFPGATFIPEWFCGLVKSWTVVAGFPRLVDLCSRDPSKGES